MTRSSIRNQTGRLLRWGITIIGLWLVMRQLSLSALSAQLRQSHWQWIVVALALMVVSLFVRALRWQILLHGVGASVGFGRLVRVYFIGNFFNSFLPSGFGGDAVRIVEVAKEVDGSVAAGTVIVDRLTGLMMLFVMALCALPWRPASFPSGWAIGIGLLSIGGLLAGLILLQGAWLRSLMGFFGRTVPNINIIGRVFDVVDRILAAIQRCGRAVIFRALLISLLFNSMLVGWWFATARALSLDIGYGYLLVVVPVLSLALLVPSIGGLGVRESLAPLLFAGTGVSAEAAVALALLVWLLLRLASLTGAPVYLTNTVSQDL